MTSQYINVEDLGPFEEGLVDRTVGDSLLFVTLKKRGKHFSCGFHPQDLLIRSGGKVSPYRGQSFHELGLLNGTTVGVVGLQDPDTPDHVVVDLDAKPGFLRRLMRL